MPHQFLADGYCRAYAAVKAEIAAEDAERMATAGFWQRLLGKWRMHLQIERRLRTAAPPDACY